MKIIQKTAIVLAVVTAVTVSVSSNTVLAATSSNDMLELSEQSGEELNYAGDIKVTVGGSYAENMYVQSGDNLVHFYRSSDSTDIVGQVWTGDGWSAEEVIVVDGVNWNYNINRTNISALADGTIVWLYDYIITYSAADGFAYYSYPDTSVSGIIMPDGVVFLDCDETDDGTGNLVGEMFVSTWKPGTEASAQQALGSCNGQIPYVWNASNDVLIDFVHGIAYDMANNYAVIDDFEGSTSLGQDDSETYVTARNNYDDQVLATPTVLLGYDYSDQQWADSVTLDGLEVRHLYTTEDQEQIIALVSNDDYSTYAVYVWSSDNGWSKAGEYEVDAETMFLVPTTTKKTDEFYSAFWQNSTDTLTVYRTTAEDGTTQVTERTLLCNANCTFAMDVSAKGKVFLTWKKSSALYASAWTPEEDVWEDKLLVKNSSVSQIIESQVGDGGDWFVNYQARKHVQFIMRWTPDGGWNKKQIVVSQKEFFDGTNYYLTYINVNTDDLNVRKLTSSGKELIETVADTYKYNTTQSFLFSDRLFLSTQTMDNETLLTAVQL